MSMPMTSLPHPQNADPLVAALLHKEETGAAGAIHGRVLAAGEGWQVVDVVCTSGPRDQPFEERHALASVSIVLSGTFGYRSDEGTTLMHAGSLLLGNAGQAFECSHRHGEGDRCLSFQFEPGLFERLARDAGASRTGFDCQRLPPLPGLARLTAHARAAIEQQDSFEEVAFQLAGSAIRAAGRANRQRCAPARHHGRIARVLRELPSRMTAPSSLSELADMANLSPYHFLRTFKHVTGVTPHQWLVRLRLREAAHRLLQSNESVTEIAFDVGFGDLSNFIRSFRAEFGTSPRRFRYAG